MAKDDAENYATFWEGYARYIKQGVSIELEKPEALYPLLRFHTTVHPDTWSSLDDYIDRMPDDQDHSHKDPEPNDKTQWADRD